MDFDTPLTEIEIESSRHPSRLFSKRYHPDENSLYRKIVRDQLTKAKELANSKLSEVSNNPPEQPVVMLRSSGSDYSNYEVAILQSGIGSIVRSPYRKTPDTPNLEPLKLLWTPSGFDYIEPRTILVFAPFYLGDPIWGDSRFRMAWALAYTEIINESGFAQAVLQASQHARVLLPVELASSSEISS